ncbi:MAG: sigma-70 family RNA polymerase sigma factor [Candidatus Hydrogenedentales bacterium]|jgi:RNA polymerase sigma-70 factor (ECF subfamily)
MDSDGSVVERVLDGDVQAFEVLVRRYERTVRAKARSVLGNSHLLDDATQQAFVTAFERLASLRNPAAFPGWLLQIAYRHALGMAKEEKRRLPIESQVNPGQTGADASERNQLLLTAITHLPEHEQIVVMAHYFEGHSVNDVAAMQGCPVGSVTKQLQRARERLRKRMRRDDL